MPRVHLAVSLGGPCRADEIPSPQVCKSLLATPFLPPRAEGDSIFQDAGHAWYDALCASTLPPSATPSQDVPLTQTHLARDATSAGMDAHVRRTSRLRSPPRGGRTSWRCCSPRPEPPVLPPDAPAGVVVPCAQNGSFYPRRQVGACCCATTMAGAAATGKEAPPFVRQAFWLSILRHGDAQTVVAIVYNNWFGIGIPSDI